MTTFNAQELKTKSTLKSLQDLMPNAEEEQKKLQQQLNILQQKLSQKTQTIKPNSAQNTIMSQMMLEVQKMQKWVQGPRHQEYVQEYIQSWMHQWTREWIQQSHSNDVHKLHQELYQQELCQRGLCQQGLNRYGLYQQKWIQEWMQELCQRKWAQNIFSQTNADVLKSIIDYCHHNSCEKIQHKFHEIQQKIFVLLLKTHGISKHKLDHKHEPIFDLNADEQKLEITLCQKVGTLCQQDWVQELCRNVIKLTTFKHNADANIDVKDDIDANVDVVINDNESLTKFFVDAIETLEKLDENINELRHQTEMQLLRHKMYQHGWEHNLSQNQWFRDMFLQDIKILPVHRNMRENLFNLLLNLQMQHDLLVVHSKIQFNVHAEMNHDAFSTYFRDISLLRQQLWRECHTIFFGNLFTIDNRNSKFIKKRISEFEHSLMLLRKLILESRQNDIKKQEAMISQQFWGKGMVQNLLPMRDVDLELEQDELYHEWINRWMWLIQNNLNNVSLVK